MTTVHSVQFGVASNAGVASPDVASTAGVASPDVVATEEPLEIRLLSAGQLRPVAVTMRTPGADFELAAGFLFTEGALSHRAQVRRISYCVDKHLDEAQQFNIVNVDTAASDLAIDFARLERHFSMTSACGVCGKATLEALRLRGFEELPEGPVLSAELIGLLPSKMREAQKLFKLTGGLHAAGLFSAEGDLVAVREDVGRHNAMDKLIGWAFLEQRLPLSAHVVVVSGRASFELVQKALAAGVPALCAVSAPTSLAVNLAREFGLTLAAFVRPGSFRVYSGAERVTSR